MHSQPLAVILLDLCDIILNLHKNLLICIVKADLKSNISCPCLLLLYKAKKKNLSLKFLLPTLSLILPLPQLRSGSV